MTFPEEHRAKLRSTNPIKRKPLKALMNSAFRSQLPAC